MNIYLNILIAIFWTICVPGQIFMIYMDFRRHRRLKKMDDEFIASIRDARESLKAHELRVMERNQIVN